MIWNGACLKTWSSTQTVIALSSGEAEYCAALRGSSEELGLQAMAKDMGLRLQVIVHTDASA